MADKIVTDDGWKEQARKEKEKLADKEQAQPTAPPDIKPAGSEQAEASPVGAAPAGTDSTDAAAGDKQSSGTEGSAQSATKSAPLPPANFLMMINSLAIQALYFMGKLPDPNDPQKQPEVNLDMAKHNIDMLQMLEDKTRGNLTDDENKALATTLHELRMQYVQCAS